MRVFKTKLFAKYARSERLDDKKLLKATEDATQGLIAADLGGGVIKQRIGRKGQGKSGGYRVLIAFRAGVRAIYLFGFARNEKDNIDDRQLATLKDIAASWFKADAKTLKKAIADKFLIEVEHGNEGKEDEPAD